MQLEKWEKKVGRKIQAATLVDSGQLWPFYGIRQPRGWWMPQRLEVGGRSQSWSPKAPARHEELYLHAVEAQITYSPGQGGVRVGVTMTREAG